MKYLSILNLLFFSTLLLGQQLEPSFNTVIAPSGLKLRDAPNLNSKVISVIPFHGKVTYVDEQHHGCDTIGLLSYYPEMVLGEVYYTRYYEHRSIVGHWVSVSYQGKEGYVYNPYLGPDDDHLQKQDFFLISPGDNCGDQFYALDQFQIYGIYRKGNKVWTEAIQVNYVIQKRSGGFLAPILTAEKNKYLEFVIGSRKIMTSSLQQWSIFRPDPREDLKITIDKFNANLPEVVVLDRVLPGNEVVEKALFFDRKTGEKQIIDNANYGTSYKIIGKGDLDGDGRRDILLEFRNAELLTRRLYLSTLATKGNFFGLAAEESFGFGCPDY